MEDTKQEQSAAMPTTPTTPTTPTDVAQPLKTVGDALQSTAARHLAEMPEEQKPDVEKLIAEAEQRGYLRGVNEQIEKRMARPGLLEIAVGDADKTENPRRCQILNVVRPCVWDL